MNLEDIRYTVETLNFTKSLPHDMQGKFVDIILHCGKAGTIPKMTSLFKEGDTEGDEGYILLDGEIVVRSHQKPEFPVFGPELLGEMKQFNPESLRTSTVEAVDDLDVLSFTWEEFWDAAKSRLSGEEEVAQLKEGLSNYAWEHFSW